MSQTDNEKIEKMIKENEKLIYYVYNGLSKNNYLKRYKEEFLDAGLVGLWKGCKTYDESKKMKLSTYLYRCIKNEMLQFIRSQNLMKDELDRNSISLDSPVKKRSDSSIITVEDTLYYSQDFFGFDVEEYVDIYFRDKKKTPILEEKVRTILKLLANGFTPREIARIMLISYTNIYYYINNIKNAILLDRKRGG